MSDEQTQRFKVLLVDDDRGFVERTSRSLGKRYDVGVAYSGIEVEKQIEALRPDAVLLDIGLGNGPDGFEVLAQIRGMDDPPQVLMLTGESSPEAVVRAIKSGAFHYACKGCALSELVNLVDRAAEATANRRRLRSLERKVSREKGFIFQDRSMQRVDEMIRRVAPTDTTVLLIGETGTGKEVVADRIHELSRRASGPIKAVNCAAISPELIESQLFGHVRGGFTGAFNDHAGYFLQAQGGTLFLDEIGVAPEGVQVKLLRALEQREIQRVGAETTESVDVRVITASSGDLEESVSLGKFREDLLHRLNVYRIDLPPLRARREDIVPLAEHFLQLASEKQGRLGLEFSTSAVEFLRGSEWKGNVRELKNAIERAVIDTRDSVITRQTLSVIVSRWPAVLPPFKEAQNEFRRRYVEAQLERTGGNITEAARRSGKARPVFSKMMKELGIDWK